MQDQEMGDIPLSVEESVLTPECFDDKKISKSTDAQRWVPLVTSVRNGISACRNHYVAVIVFLIVLGGAVAIPSALSAKCVEKVTTVIQMLSGTALGVLELKHTNEDLQQTNKDLQQTNKDLQQTNKDLDHKLREMEEKFRACDEELVDQCVDLIQNNTALGRCNWTTCETKRIDAPATSIYATWSNTTWSNTTWYPEDCSNHIMPEWPVCKTTKGFSKLLMVRPHPKCQGQRQFCCSCEGQPPDYSNILEIKELDCTGFIKLCEKL